MTRRYASRAAHPGSTAGGARREAESDEVCFRPLCYLRPNSRNSIEVGVVKAQRRADSDRALHVRDTSFLSAIRLVVWCGDRRDGRASGRAYPSKTRYKSGGCGSQSNTEGEARLRY
jgi:hypothetical protein